MPLLLVSALLAAVQSALPAAIHSHSASYAGVWAVTAVESDGVSTADDKIKTKALAMYPTSLTLQKDGRYLRRHANFAGAENEDGTFTVVRGLSGWAEVDVSATLRIRGDGRPQDIKFQAKEVWRLTAAGTLQRCYSNDTTKGRPRGFKTANGDGLVAVTYTRVKAPAGIGAVAVGLATNQEKVIRQFDTGDQGAIRVAISPNGRFALSGGSDGTVRYWEIATGKELKKFKEHTGEAYTVAFHPQGRLALSGGDDNQLLLWDLESGEKVRGFTGHTGNVCGAVFSPDGKHIASGSWDTTIRVWDVETGKELKKLEGHTAGIMAVGYSPNGKLLASAGGDDKSVRLWDVESGKELKKLEGHTAMVRAIWFSADGQHILSGGYKGDGTARLWDVLTGKELLCLKDSPEGVHGVAISPDGLRALVAGTDRVQLWDLQKGELLHTFEEMDSATDSVFLPDGKQALLSTGGDKRLRLVRLPK